ncbi:alpha/beta hydrolase [Variovorax humicola]|uniref:Alpha/beta hydrolase n=1 Tax=Variovorax humicola TaxID=1769758 RepID=A0ABU8VWN4_9BURK
MTTAASHAAVAPPSRVLQYAEFRAAWELGATLSLWPLLKLAPRGDGHPVIVFPGLGATDWSTRLLRRYLRGRGYDTHGWGLGRNLGPRMGVEAGMLGLLEELHAHSGRKISLIGWSLGGAYARMLASRRPEFVRSVITLGSPFAAGPQSTHAWRIYEGLSGQNADDNVRMKYVRPTPPVPTTSIFSRSDGVVAWRGSLETPGPTTENVEVFASHIGLGANPTVLYAVADRLSQPEGEWKPFNRNSIKALVYPNPHRGL